MKNIWIYCLLLVSLFACRENNDFVTESGIEVNCIEKGTGAALLKDSVTILYLKIESDSGELITETSPLNPLAMAYDPELKAGHLQEVLKELESGDSVYFETTALNLFTETYGQQVPPNFTEETVMKVNMKLVDVMSQERYRAYIDDIRAKQQVAEAASMDEKLAADGATIDAYLEEKGIEAITSESGLRYVVTREGNGAVAESGDEIVVHYDGRLLSGEAFDSSRERGQPFSFTVGQGRVIKGWDEGIPYIPEGGMATLYIPSPLGYGSRAAGPVIKPYSILVFDVEVLEVKKN